MKSMARYKLVVSDFHLGKGRYSPDGTPNILEDFIYDAEFAEFLNYYRSGTFADAEVEIILNGDILNLIQLDHYGIYTHIHTERAVVNMIRRIIKGHPQFFQALQRFAKTPNHKISYVIGNHDSGMLWPKAKAVFEEAVGAPVNFYEVAYEFDGIRVEHGQQYEHFTRTDMKNPFITRGVPEPVLNLPWGSLFNAVFLPEIKQERPHIDKVKPFGVYARWALINDTWWAMKTALKTAKFIIDTLLFRRRYQIKDGVKFTLGLIKELSLYPDFDKIAFKILDERDDIHTVIFGHTHILKHRRWKEGKEYFNEGSWNQVTNLDIGEFGTQTVLSYAFIEYPIGEAHPTRPKVKLKQWKGSWKPETDLQV
jgi:UDP-2,3-diacylglucosamine pyrophosphatase LpxH